MHLQAWRHARNILCIRLDYLGDVLMCTPAMRALKAGQAGDGEAARRITLLTSGSGAAVARFIPEVDEVIPYAAPWMKSSHKHAAAMDLALVEQLRSRNFDAAVIFTTYSQSVLPAALLCHLAGIPLRLAHCRENPYQLLSDWIPETEPDQQVRHEVQRQLDLVAAAGYRPPRQQLSFAVPQADRDWAGAYLESRGIGPGQPWVLLHPGATAASRRYPPKHWAEVVQALVDEAGHPVVLTGSAAERALIDTILPIPHPLAHVEAGTLELGQLGALIERATVVIANNTGPAHIAAALGTPLVSLYALTNPQHTPWQVVSRVLFRDVPCRNCYKSVCPEGHHACLEQVSPLQVLEEAQDLLAASRESGQGQAAAGAAVLPVSLPVRALALPAATGTSASSSVR